MSNVKEAVSVPKIKAEITRWQTLAPQARVAKVVIYDAMIFNFNLLILELLEFSDATIEEVGLCCHEALSSMSAIVLQLVRPVYATVKENITTLKKKVHSKQMKGQMDLEVELESLRQGLAQHDALVRGLKQKIESVTSSMFSPSDETLMSRRSPSEVVLEALLRSSNNAEDFQAQEKWLLTLAEVRRQVNREQRAAKILNPERFAGYPRAIAVAFRDKKLFTGSTLIEWTKHLKDEELQGDSRTLHDWYRDIRQGRYTGEEQAFIDRRIALFNQIYHNKNATKTQQAVNRGEPQSQARDERIIAEALTEMHDEEMVRRPTTVSQYCSQWCGVAFDTTTLEFKPPCVMCRCAYPVNYPPSALPALGAGGEGVNCAEVHHSTYHGKCCEGHLIGQILRFEDWFFL